MAVLTVARRTRLGPRGIAARTWAPRVLGGVAAAMVPWVVVLQQTLPATTVVRHWQAVWVGLDLMIALGCAVTAVLYGRGDRRAALSASAVAALAVMDAWFDVLTAQAGGELALALACAVPELSLAGFCAAIALRDSREATFA
ncbi:hypothetical protein [Amycolatopsis sp. CA-230715]|uniref:hypothetical protein n=1 Tax=Amycolatopsis sp. CA-230715 TaxID=2745196 RepID=UPI001C00B362|nr:hypothetical protein [Amycolatopsis sp. CA-230715]QWF83369.1 hypothetical protein HUW46_06809 [Amycolatopsis sp. CA-230715]